MTVKQERREHLPENAAPRLDSPTGAEALSYLGLFGSITVLNGHIHEAAQKIEGKIAFHTAMSTPSSQRALGAAAHPRATQCGEASLREALHGLPRSRSRSAAFRRSHGSATRKP
jgi:hypothetical protein